MADVSKVDKIDGEGERVMGLDGRVVGCAECREEITEIERPLFPLVTDEVLDVDRD